MGISVVLLIHCRDDATNIADFSLMAANYGLTFTPASPARSVPEPTASLLVASIVIAASHRKSR
jgi:hypothetical protein